MPAPPTVALVLCGGGARRFGSDKTRADLGGRPLLDVLLVSLPDVWSVVCVGEERPTARAVTWTRENPPGGGPVAGVAAGVTALEPYDDATTVLVLGGDMPLAGPGATALVAALGDAADARAAAARDGEGRVQPLLAAYRLGALRAALPVEPAGERLTPLLLDLDPLLVDLPDAGLDVDTPADLEAARRRVGP